MKTTIIIIGTIILFITILNLVISSKIQTKTIIHASKNEVWNHLMNHNDYSRWNPFIKEISGSDKIGEQLKVKISMSEKNQ